MIKPYFLVILFLTLSMTFFNSRCGEKPGEGELAKKGYENAKPIIESLEKYKQEKGVYPKTLAELTPQYLEKLPLDESGENYKYQYKADTKSYVLSFNYDAPGLGICECNYYPEKKQWFCNCLI